MKTKSKSPYLLFAIFFALSAHAQITFEKMIPGDHENIGNDVVQTFDSGYVVCGTDGYYYYQWPFWSMTLIKTDQFGSVLWNYEYGPSIDNGGFSVQQTADNGLVACGYSQFDGIFHALLLKTDQSGAPIVMQTYAYQGENTWSYSVKQCYDQGFIICGVVYPTSLPFASLLIRTNSDGDTLWEKTYGNSESGKSVLCLPDSGFVMLSVGSGSPLYLRRLSKFGEVVWERNFTSVAGDAFKETSDGGYIICGKALLDNPYQIGLLKTTQDGDSLWFKKFPYHADANSLEVTTDGGYLIGGTIYDSPASGLKQLFLLRTNQNGELLWTRKFGGSLQDDGNAVKSTTDTGFIFTGTTIKPGTDSIMVYLIKGIDDDTATGNNIEQSPQKTLMIYPNPTNGVINIKFNEIPGDVYLKIIDLLGSCIFMNAYHEVKDILSVQIPDQFNGMYLVTIRTKEYLKTNKIFIKRSE